MKVPRWNTNHTSFSGDDSLSILKVKRSKLGVLLSRNRLQKKNLALPAPKISNNQLALIFSGTLQSPNSKEQVSRLGDNHATTASYIEDT
ncbi:hypothetical protein P8452_17514 [Trifolium repens]|nr:hypothetical protein P8452_17514 [Trifolium repens]